MEELCYINALASFELLNTSITLLYISCVIKALLLGLFIMSDELKVTLEKAVFNFSLLLNNLAYTKKYDKLIYIYYLLIKPRLIC